MKRKTLFWTILNWGLFIGSITVGIAGTIMISIPGSDELFGLIMLTSGFTAAGIHFVALFFHNKNNAYKIEQDILANDFETRIVNEAQKKSGFITYDESGKIIFITENLLKTNFKRLLGKNLSFLPIDIKKTTEQIEVVNGTSYKFIHNERRRIIHVIDNSEVDRLEKIIRQKQHAVTIIKLDYSDKVKYKASTYAEITTRVSRILNQYASLTDGTLSISQTGDEIIVVSEWGSTTAMVDSNEKFFTLFDKLNEDRKNVIISMGLSSNNGSVNELTNEARLQLREAISKGGNMGVVNHNGKKHYIGTSFKGDIERSQIQVQFFASVLNRKIMNARNVVVTCHNYADADAVASTLAMAELVQTLYGKTVNIYLDTFDNTGKIAYMELGRPLHELNIKKEDLDKQIKTNTLLIIVDTTDGNRLQFNRKTLDKFHQTNRVIIDHHRVSHEPIKTDLDSTLLDTNISSASELVTNLIQVKVNGAEDAVSNWTTIQLLALGIFVDSNGLTKNTGPGTFNAVSWLTLAGADTKVITRYMNISKSAIPEMIELFQNVTIVKNKYIFSEFDGKTKLPDDVISQFANMLLNFRGIEASFVIAKNVNNRIKVSARSKDTVNVQQIMQKIGGGGHFDIAAASFPSNVGVASVSKKIKRIVRGL